MKQYFKKHLLNLARKIIQKFDPSTEKNLRFIENFEVHVIDRSDIFSEKEWLDSIFDKNIQEKVHYKCAQTIVNALFCKGLIQSNLTVSNTIHRYDQRITVLFPKT